MWVLAACGSPAHAPFADPDGSGALFGAYVSPEQYSYSYTDPGRAQAVEAFEASLGQPLSIVHNYHKWDVDFPSSFDRYVVDRGSVLLLSWAGTYPRDILSGRYDAMVRARAEALKSLGGHVLLRWRWEMNRRNLKGEIGSPDQYVAAWKHLRAIFDEVQVDTVDWVWCPLANGFEGTNAPAYFPGDDQVEWLCADAYTLTPEEPLADVLAPFFTWAESHDLPVVIGEFGTVPGAPDARARWYDATMTYLREQPRVRGVVYFESGAAPEGRFEIFSEPSAFLAMRRWAESDWLNPDWAPP